VTIWLCRTCLLADLQARLEADGAAVEPGPHWWLMVRYERRADILTAFLYLACALICARKLQPL
jgi:hypothetical protein